MMPWPKLKIPVVLRPSSYVHLEEEQTGFWSLLLILSLGIVFFGYMQKDIIVRYGKIDALQISLQETLESHLVLQKQITELTRINNALTTRAESAEGKLDWETLRFLSFQRLDMVGKDEAIVYINVEEIEGK